jgi:hypothetical protein
MTNSSGNFTSLRAYSPFRVISMLWKGSDSVSPSPCPVETVSLNILSRHESFEDLQVLDLSARIKPTTPLSSSNSPDFDSLSQRQEATPLKRSVSFNDVVEALLITPRHEPAAEEIRNYIELEWEKGNLSMTREIARDALIQHKRENTQVSSRIVRLKLLD